MSQELSFSRTDPRRAEALFDHVLAMHNIDEYVRSAYFIRKNNFTHIPNLEQIKGTLDNDTFLEYFREAFMLAGQFNPNQLANIASTLDEPDLLALTKNINIAEPQKVIVRQVLPYAEDVEIAEFITTELYQNIVVRVPQLEFTQTSLNETLDRLRGWRVYIEIPQQTEYPHRHKLEEDFDIDNHTPNLITARMCPTADVQQRILTILDKEADYFNDGYTDYLSFVFANRVANNVEFAFDDFYEILDNMVKSYRPEDQWGDEIPFQLLAFAYKPQNRIILYGIRYKQTLFMLDDCTDPTNHLDDTFYYMDSRERQDIDTTEFRRVRVPHLNQFFALCLVGSYFKNMENGVPLANITTAPNLWGLMALSYIFHIDSDDIDGLDAKTTFFNYQDRVNKREGVFRGKKYGINATKQRNGCSQQLLLIKNETGKMIGRRLAESRQCYCRSQNPHKDVANTDQCNLWTCCSEMCHWHLKTKCGLKISCGGLLPGNYPVKYVTSLGRIKKDRVIVYISKHPQITQENIVSATVFRPQEILASDRFFRKLLNCLKLVPSREDANTKIVEARNNYTGTERGVTHALVATRLIDKRDTLSIFIEDVEPYSFALRISTKRLDRELLEREMDVED